MAIKILVDLIEITGVPSSQETITSDIYFASNTYTETLTSNVHFQKLGIQEVINSEVHFTTSISQTLVSDVEFKDHGYNYLVSGINFICPGKLATDIKYYNNKLYISCETSPARLIIADITSGTPASVGYDYDDSGESYDNPSCLTINIALLKLFMACDNGKIAKINMTTPTTREEIDVNITEDIVTISDCEANKITYVGTNKVTYDLYEIDEQEASHVNTDLRWIKNYYKKVKTFISYVFKTVINTDLRYIKTVYSHVNTDLRYQIVPFSETVAISLDDIHIYLDGVELDDCDRGSINVLLNVDDLSKITFTLARKHDCLDYKLDGTLSEITDNNEITIRIKDKILYDNESPSAELVFVISEIDCSGDDESVSIIAYANEYNHNVNTLDLSLPTLNTQINLYDIISNQVKIDNPVIDPLDDNSKYYNGVKVDMGTLEIESQYKEDGHLGFFDIDTYTPDQNYTYFWFVSGNNFVTKDSFNNVYLGTSLSPASSDTYAISSMGFYKQRLFNNLVTALGFYYLGTAPYKEITSKNGEYISWERWEDKEDGMYVVRNSSYHYINYAKAVAAAEYSKIKNINGTILPKTSSEISITIDAFCYYNLGLLQRINVINTTQAGIYKNLNGFPVSTKSISIDFGNMIVNLSNTNDFSQGELDTIDDTLPTEPLPDAELNLKIHNKFDLNKQEEIT
jgi:hypothetical protein